MKTREYYYGAEAFGAEWEEMKKNILAEMREKYKNCIVQDVDYLDHMPFDRDGHHATGYEVKIDGFWDYDYEEQKRRMKNDVSNRGTKKKIKLCREKTR